MLVQGQLLSDTCYLSIAYHATVRYRLLTIIDHTGNRQPLSGLGKAIFNHECYVTLDKHYLLI
jgi:hypothetical protein